MSDVAGCCIPCSRYSSLNTTTIFLISGTCQSNPNRIGCGKFSRYIAHQLCQPLVIQKTYIARAKCRGLNLPVACVNEHCGGTRASSLDAKSVGPFEFLVARHAGESLGEGAAAQVYGLGFVGLLRYPRHMTETEQAILDTLVELEAAVAQVNVDPKPDLISIFGRLDDLTVALPKDASPNLLHYLHKKSYQKARLFLQGQDPEQGECPH